MGVFPSKKLTEIACVGLDNAGKTTMLERLNVGKVEWFTPTIGFDLERLDGKNVGVRIISWNCGGRDPIHPLKRVFCADATAIIFVVDSSSHTSPDRMEDAIHELRSILRYPVFSDVMKPAPVLVLRNKQDVPGAMSVKDIEQVFAPVKDAFPNKLIFRPSCMLTDTPEDIMAHIQELLDILKPKKMPLAEHT